MDHHTDPAGIIYRELFFDIRYRFVHIGRQVFQAYADLVQSDRISLFIIIDQIIPKCNPGNIFGIVPVFLHFSFSDLCIIFYPFGDSRSHIGRITVFAVNNFYTGMIHIIMFFHPQSESGQSGRNGRHFKRQTFERSVSPRLVIRRESGQIHPHQQIIVRHIEYPVISIQITGNEEDLHFIFLGITQFLCPDTVHHRIVGTIVEIMCQIKICRGNGLIR